jgi:hypothetical protein
MGPVHVLRSLQERCYAEPGCILWLASCSALDIEISFGLKVALYCLTQNTTDNNLHGIQQSEHMDVPISIFSPLKSNILLVYLV